MTRCANPFETDYALYDAWFEENANVYQSELLAVEALLPQEGRRVEVGVGSGRFASRLGITEGIEPAAGIATLARARGITVLQGVAEDLPLEVESVDVLLYVTTLCFVSDIQTAFQEAHRILRSSGCVVLAYIPKDSPFGALYEETADQDPFFKQARFYTRVEVRDTLTAAGFRIDRTVQTLTGPPEWANERVEPPVEGDDRGSFVVLRALKL